MTKPKKSLFSRLLLWSAGSRETVDSPSLARTIVRFVADQSIKTYRKPSRILPIVLGLIAKPLRGPISWLSSLIENIPDHMSASLLKSFSKAFIIQSNLIAGANLLNENKPEEAWVHLNRCIKYSKNPHHYFLAGVCQLVGLGNFERAMAIFTRGNNLRAAEARRLGLERSPIRFLDPIWAGALGHLAQTDYLIKLSILEGRSPAETVIYLPPEAKIANRFLLDQWRPHYTVVEDEAKLPLPLESLNSLAFDFLAPRLADGSTVPLWKLAAETYRRWHAEGRGPLLTISPDVEKRARSVLSSVGIPQDAWFVALHVREAGSNIHHASLHDVLNADIFDYTPAIEEIVRRGGWVVRMGDPTMSPLPPSTNVFDYCHSNIRADWMDIYLLAKCRFLLGTSSGPAYVPPIYGVPSILTNWWPPAQRPWHPQDIFVPKRVTIAKNRILTLAQSLEEPFGYCNSLSYLKTEKNATIENNSPEDIAGAVVEMFDQINNTVCSTEEDIVLRHRANQIYESFDIHGMSGLSRDFLRRHREFLD